ncbi:hypothetical protein [Methylobacterium tardum]|uniref:hypothetical protein n=1 Tax=Methylobacterium tardum TaxID=374432 RepID=UPI0036093A8C
MGGRAIAAVQGIANVAVVLGDPPLVGGDRRVRLRGGVLLDDATARELGHLGVDPRRLRTGVQLDRALPLDVGRRLDDVRRIVLDPILLVSVLHRRSFRLAACVTYVRMTPPRAGRRHPSVGRRARIGDPSSP